VHGKSLSSLMLMIELPGVPGGKIAKARQKKSKSRVSRKAKGGSR